MASETRKPPPHAWKPGQSGNPKGKPPGSGKLQELRASISEHVPEILERLVSAAREGDLQAARLILERVLPPLKAVELPQPIDLPEDGLALQGRAVLAAVAAGKLAPGTGTQLLSAIAAVARITEIDELTRRIEALEGKP